MYCRLLGLTGVLPFVVGYRLSLLHFGVFVCLCF